MLGLLVGLVGCAHREAAGGQAGFGPDPTLPRPHTKPIPTINVATRVGWAAGEHPVAAPGFVVNAFAEGLDHPRWLYVLPNGDVLVAETNAPERPEDSKGIKAWFRGKLMAKAGGAVPSPDRITLLRDADGDGVAETRTVFLRGLVSPFGMALLGDELYVADTDALLRFHYPTGATELAGPGTRIVDLPAGPINHHWTKNVIADAAGTTLYVSVGSNSNVAENGIEVEAERAAIWAVDPLTGAHHVFASGLRNPVGMAWEPVTGALWTSVNERDELGDDLVPDYMTSVHDAGFYGWPYSYYGQHVDRRVKPQRPDLVAQATVPDYALGAHTASLGLCAASGTALPAAFQHGMFVGQHGSWNRKPRAGYKVIFVPFRDGRPDGAPVDVLTGFIEDSGEAHGRPVGVTIDRAGALLVADDVGNAIWRVASASPGR